MAGAGCKGEGAMAELCWIRAPGVGVPGGSLRLQRDLWAPWQPRSPRLAQSLAVHGTRAARPPSGSLRCTPRQLAPFPIPALARILRPAHSLLLVSSRSALRQCTNWFVVKSAQTGSLRQCTNWFVATVHKLVRFVVTVHTAEREETHYRSKAFALSQFRLCSCCVCFPCAADARTLASTLG